MSQKNKLCRACEATGHDSKHDHLYLMADGSRWTCRHTDYHENGEVYYEGLDGEPMSMEVAGASAYAQLQAVLMDKGFTASTSDVPTVAPSRGPVSVEDLRSTYRGIEPATYKKYETQGQYDNGGTLLKLYSPVYNSLSGALVTRKIRTVDPKAFSFEASTGGASLQFFGQSIFGGEKRILVTEGELDSMSAYQMLQKWNVACVSLPTGANAKSIIDNLDFILSYTKGNKEVYLCMDEDEPGREALKAIVSLIPRAKVLKLPLKDANDMLVAGREAEFISAFWDAEIYKPPSIVRVSSVMSKVLMKPVIGRPWPWPTLTKLTYGRRDGEGMYVGAGVKIGKSEFINELVAFDCKNGHPIAAIKYEEQPAVTVKRVCGKIDGTYYHKPDVEYDDKILEATALSLEANLFLHNAFGSADWEHTKEYIRYVVAMGCKTVIIDPVTKLSNHLDSSGTETMLRKLSDELACMAQDLGFFYIVTCHLKAPTTGPPHEAGGRVHSNQYRGSRSMMENAFYLLGIERNKDPSLPQEERNTSTFVLLEDRNFGNNHRWPVFYNTNDQSYLEPTLTTSF